MTEIQVTNITTQVEVEAGYELYEVLVEAVDSTEFKGVLSVTGDGVGGTASNPVLTFPTSGQITEDADKRFVSDAQLAVIEDTSGVNTGDQDISGIATNAEAIVTLQNTKENSIAAGTTAQYWRGDKTFQDFGTAARASVLTGYTVGGNTAIAAGDTILQAFEKTQAQINARVSGTIASGQVAFGTGVNTVGGDSGFTWDNTNKRVGLNVTPTAILDVSGTASSGFDAIKFKSQFTATGFLGTDNANVWLSSATAGGGSALYMSSTTLRFFRQGGETARFDVNGFGILTTSPTNTLDVNGTARIRTIDNLGATPVEVLVPSATGVVSKRTLTEFRTDLGAVGGTGTVNRVPKFTAAGTIGDGILTDDANGVYNTGKGNSTFFGYRAGFLDDGTNNGNTYFGYEAGNSNISSASNTMIGYQSGWVNTGGSNTFIGSQAGISNTSGINNSFVGSTAGFSNNTGNSNLFIGLGSGNKNTSGSNNTFLGTQAGRENITGIQNVALGLSAGRFIADGVTPVTVINNSVFLGVDSRANASGETNQIVIGYQSIGRGSNTTTIGNTSTTSSYLFGTLRAGTINNLGSAATNVLVPSATGVLSLRTISEFQSDFLTTITGYNAGTTQTLKHVSGVFQWVNG